VSKLRVAIVRAPFFEGLDPEVQKATEAAVEVLRQHVTSVADVTLPPSAGLALIGPEAYAYHSKWITDSPALYQAATRAILERSADLKAPAYAAALHQLYQLRRDVKKVFLNVDLLITPTMPGPPVTIEQSKTQSAPTRNTAPFDVFGLPTISLPCGFTSSGLPVGLQISGAPFAETTVLALSHAYEQATDWHTRRPIPNPV
jgi:aspartyl-tRNA(Asn)/glutamyl-tRNA(Gln) amidotransferase subunit A